MIMWRISSDNKNGWFSLISAYRLASFRVMIASVTLMQHVPMLDRFISRYYATTFHVPMIPGLPSISWKPFWLVVIVLQHIAAWGLFFGILPRLAAGFLAISGVYVFLLDTEHFAHNTWFHLHLLALIAFSSDRVSFRRLLNDDNTARCPAWPEYLIRLQLSIVFFYAALDKVFSPFWGLTGGILAHRSLDHHAPPLRWLQDFNRIVIDWFPGVTSVGTIIVEFFFAVALLFRPLWHIAVPLGLVFGAYLEFMLTPGAFIWDLTAALILFLPVNDQSYIVLHRESCNACQWTRRIVSRLDWLRRLKWVSFHEAERSELYQNNAKPLDAGRGLLLIRPSGRVCRGIEAFRSLFVLLPAPLFVIFVIIRFGGFGSRIFGIIPGQDLVFLIVAGLMLLWVPGVARLVETTLYAWLVRVFTRIFQPGNGINSKDGQCLLHNVDALNEAKSRL